MRKRTPTHRLHDWLRDRIRAARLRARAERELPRTARWRRWVWRGAAELAFCYVWLNVLAVACITRVVETRIECHVVDAATGAPVVDAVVRRSEWEWQVGARCDPAGCATFVDSRAPFLLWELPAIGTCPLGGSLRVEAPGHRPVEVGLPPRFDWPLFGRPRAEVTVRLLR